MTHSEDYPALLALYFSGHPREEALYAALYRQMEEAFPQASVQVQKSQISFYNRHFFAAASLPVRRRKGWPKECLMVSFGLGYRVEDPRIAVAVEPYPNRWTHHVVVDKPEQIDGQLLSWLREAWDFGESK